MQQSRFIMGFLAGALAVGGTWYFTTNLTDPTGAAIGVRNAQQASARRIKTAARTRPAPKADKQAHEARSYGYMAFSGVRAGGETLFELRDGDQPEGSDLLNHCKLECDWEEDCRGVEMRNRGGHMSCALKGSDARSSAPNSTFHQKWESLTDSQMRTVALAQLAASQEAAELMNASRARMKQLGVPRDRLDDIAQDAVSLIEQISARGDLDTVQRTWNDMLVSWDKPSLASVNLFVRWAIRMGYEVADAELQKRSDEVERLNGERRLLWEEYVTIRKMLTPLVRAEDMTALEETVHPKDIAVWELTGNLSLQPREQVKIGTKRALDQHAIKLKRQAERADKAVKTARKALSRQLRAQQSLFQNLSKVGQILIAASDDLVGEGEAAKGHIPAEAPVGTSLPASTRKKMGRMGR